MFLKRWNQYSWIQKANVDAAIPQMATSCIKIFLTIISSFSNFSFTSFSLSHLSVSLNLLRAFHPLFLSPPPPFLPPTVPDSNIKQVGKNGQAIMIYDQCMQQLLTFIMTVVGGRERGCECVWISLQGVCVGKMRGESIGDWDHWYADSSR